MACGWEDSTPFLVVAGAGHSPVDGRYAQDGFREGKPKFKKVGGEFIIFFRWGMWKLGAEDDTNVWIYESPTDLRPSPMPPSAWVTAGQSKYSPAPSLSLGTCRDLQEGDVVTIIKLHEEVDWSGCPENTARRLALTSTPWTVTIHRLRRLRGNWFYPSEFPEKVAPLAALGMVNLMGRAHRISEIKENSTPSISGKCASPPFLVVAGAGHATLNGRYALAGNFAGKPKYKQVGGNSIIFFMSGKWRLNDEEVTDERCYDAVEVDEEARIPPSRWVKVNARYGAAPSLSLGTGRDLQVGDSVVLEKHSRSIDWSGCPEDDSSRRFSFSAPKTVTVHRLQGEWFYPAEFRTLVAPVAALGSVNFFGQAHRIEAEEEMMTSASSGENAPPLAAFLVLRGAGVGAMNGRYVQDGLEEEKPKYKQVGGNSIIYFSSGVWRLNDEENMQQRKYDGAQNDTPTPPNEWVQVDSNYGAAPKLSIGTWRDLQEGDTVTISKRHEDFDWSGCPVNSAGRLRFSPSSWTITVQRVQGDWFYPAEFETLIAPLAALGTVNLMGMACRISPVSAASRKPRDQNVADSKKGKIVGGYDEEWCAEQDVQRFKCAICLLVARAAMAHECGSDLFCEGCWEKCMSKDNKCPVCRNDGSTIVPAHFERRSIGNLKVMCPNKCGQSFPLYEKEHHLHDLCPCQQGVRADTMDADVEEDREVCSACAIS